jgi:hypothetical protein
MFPTGTHLGRYQLTSFTVTKPLDGPMLHTLPYDVLLIVAAHLNLGDIQSLHLVLKILTLTDKPRF